MDPWIKECLRLGKDLTLEDAERLDKLSMKYRDINLGFDWTAGDRLHHVHNLPNVSKEDRLLLGRVFRESRGFTLGLCLLYNPSELTRKELEEVDPRKFRIEYQTDVKRKLALHRAKFHFTEPVESFKDYFRDYVIPSAKHISRNWRKYAALASVLAFVGYEYRREFADALIYRERPQVTLSTDFPCKRGDLHVSSIANKGRAPMYAGLYLGERLIRVQRMNQFEDSSLHGAYYIENYGPLRIYHKKTGNGELIWSELHQKDTTFYNVNAGNSSAKMEVLVSDGYGNTTTREVCRIRRVLKNTLGGFRRGRARAH